MKKLPVLIAIMALTLGTACQIPVPANEAQFGAMSIKFPMNAEINGLQLKIKGTNLVLSAKSWRVHNNPKVIDASAKGAADIIEATGNQVANAFAQGIQAAAKGVKP
jgi:hypothetical protein